MVSSRQLSEPRMMGEGLRASGFCLTGVDLMGEAAAGGVTDAVFCSLL